MKKKLIIGFWIVTLAHASECQEMHPFKQGITFGYDFSGLLIKIFQPARTGGEVSLTAGAFKKMYYTVEAGILNINSKDSTNNYNYYSNGKYIRVGFDYNFYKRKTADENNMVFLGLRYGFSSLNYSADNIIIKDELWGDYGPTNVPNTKYQAQWVEFAAGIRVEIIKNFSMGWSGRLHYLIYTKGNEKIKPSVIPGFGNAYSTITLGFNYSFYYTIPLRKY